MPGYPILWDNGLFLPDSRLWLDPIRPRPQAVISHAHSDHVAAHPYAFVTPPTQRLLTHRRARVACLEALPYRQPHQTKDFTLTFYPAGHVLGSALTLVETAHGRLLYTGDLKTRRGYTAEPVEPVAADILVLESTFGKPRYTFPETAIVLRELVQWCLDCQVRREIPVLLGYSLGKGQELLTALSSEGLDIYLHPALSDVTAVYQEFNCVFPAYERLTDPAQVKSGVVICPPSGRRGKLIRGLVNAKLAAVTGWAMDRSYQTRVGVDAVFPLSDHADFGELCTFAERVGASLTYTVLGFDEDLALHLRRRGLRAQPLRQQQQLSLFERAS